MQVYGADLPQVAMGDLLQGEEWGNQLWASLDLEGDHRQGKIDEMIDQLLMN